MTAGAPLPPPPASQEPRRGLTTAVILGVAAALIAVSGVVGWSATRSDEVPDPTDTATAADAVAVADDDLGIRYTPEDAGAEPVGDPIEVELYEDFQCPACLAFEESVGDYLRGQVAAGRITIVYRPFSFLDRASPNEYSSRATNAALCVLDDAGVERFVEFHERLFEIQPAEGRPGPDDDTLAAEADDLGADARDCIEERRFADWIAESLDAGVDQGVGGTPTVVVDGEETTARTPEEFRLLFASGRSSAGSPT